MSGPRRVSLSQTGHALQPTIGGGAEAALRRVSPPQTAPSCAQRPRVVVVGLGAGVRRRELDAASVAQTRAAASPLAGPKQTVGGMGG